MSDYEPTFGDRWPNEESVPAEVRSAAREIYEASERLLAKNRANPYFPMRKWWQVLTDPHGSVRTVFYNKLGPQEVNLWTFAPEIDDEGQVELRIDKHEYVLIDPAQTSLVREWAIPGWIDLTDDELAEAIAELIGLRDARQAVQRLRGKDS